MVMEINETLATENVAENVEQTTEEAAAQTQAETAEAEEEKLYSEREFNERFNAAVGKKLARQEAKLRKEYDKKYGRLASVVKAGLRTDSVDDATKQLEEFYTGNGIEIPKQAVYGDRETEILARVEAEEIIDSGMDEVIEEAERLNAIGVENMSKKDKALFLRLTNHIREDETSRALRAIGADERIYGSEEFKRFKAKFKSDTPITEVYEMFEGTLPKKEIKTPGSVKHTAAESGVKDYYTPEEISRLTEEELKDPEVWKTVRRSMTGS